MTIQNLKFIFDAEKILEVLACFESRNFYDIFLHILQLGSLKRKIKENRGRNFEISNNYAKTMGVKFFEEHFTDFSQ